MATLSVDQLKVFHGRVKANGFDSSAHSQISVELSALSVTSHGAPDAGHGPAWYAGWHAAQDELLVDTVLPLLIRLKELEAKQ